MDVARPHAGVSPGVEGDVLVALSASTRPRTGRAIARVAGRSNTGVQAVLARLVEHGLVDRLDAGEARLYSLNRDHILAPVVEGMATARTELIRRLREEIRLWRNPPVHASLFGSVARGDGDSDSDIDLLVVRPSAFDPEDPSWQGQLDELALSVRRWTGNHAAISEVSEDDIPRFASERPPVIRDLEEHAVELAGEESHRLFTGT